MSSQPLPSDCTSAKFEQVAISRLRSLVSLLPNNCKVFREPWDCSTVLCLDFADCPTSVMIIKENPDQLKTVVQDLGIAHAIVFRINQKLMGWVGVES
ncbi:MAG: hypothetical protein AB4058_10085 [Microcystaceae cyanobacterium]